MISTKPPKITGEKYIHWDKTIGKFCVRLSLSDGKRGEKHIGAYKTLKEAIICRDKAVAEYLP